MITSQVVAESKRAERQRETLQQFAASSCYLLVVVDGDSQIGTIGTSPDVPATNFEYDQQVTVGHPVPDV